MVRVMVVDLLTGEMQSLEGAWSWFVHMDHAVGSCSRRIPDCSWHGGWNSGNVRFFPVEESRVQEILDYGLTKLEWDLVRYIEQGVPS